MKKIYMASLLLSMAITSIQGDALDDLGNKVEKLAEARDQVGGIINSLTDLKDNKLTAAKTAVEGQKANLSANDKKADEAKAKVAGVRTEVEANPLVPSSVGKPLFRALDKSTKLIGNLKVILANAQKTINNVTTDIPDARSKIGTVKSDLSSLKGKIHNLYIAARNAVNAAKSARDAAIRAAAAAKKAADDAAAAAKRAAEDTAAAARRAADAAAKKAKNVGSTIKGWFS